MSKITSIDTGPEPDTARRAGVPPRPSKQPAASAAPIPRLRLTIAGIVALTLLFGLILANRPGGRSDPPPAAVAGTPTTVGVALPATPTSATIGAAEAGGLFPSPAPSATSSEPAEVAAARSALTAWATYVAQRDPAVLGAAFDPTGPQLAQLSNEATWPAIAGYSVEVTNPTVIASNESEATVNATVTWRRPGETPQTFDWDLILRPAPDGWKLWAVHQR